MMIRQLRPFIAIFIISAQRLWSTRWLTLATAVGFMAAIGLAYSVPMYADAVYHRILSRALGITDPSSNPLPPFAFLFKLKAFYQESAQWIDAVPADDFMQNNVAPMLQLPRKSLLRYYQTANLRLFSVLDRTALEQRKPLLLIPVVALSEVGDHINLIAGSVPTDQLATDGSIGVMVSRYVADRLGVQVGDKYVAFTGREDKGAIRIPFVVTGVWEPRDRKEFYWFYRPDQLDIMLLTTETNFSANIGPVIGKNLSEAMWLSVFDGDSVRVWNAPDFLARITSVTAAMSAQKINVDLSASPQDGLLRYQRDSRTLMLQLYTFSIPLFVLVLVFVVLVAGLTIDDQRGEIAVLRSRGATGWQVLGITFLGALLLGIVALGAGAGVGLIIALFMGQARSFLTFVTGDFLPVMVTAASMPFGVGAAIVTVIITVLPVIGAIGHTILTYKQARARSLKPPWWQRIWLDVLLLIPAAYWTYLLQKQGTVDIPFLGTGNGDPLSIPGLFLVPALAMFAITLVFIRLLPLFLRLVAWILKRLPGVGLLLATQQLARSPGYYAAPMLLMVLTLALATFTASIATTLDQYLDQQARYTVGGDVLLAGIGVNTRPATTPSSSSFGQVGLLDSNSGSQIDLAAALQTEQNTGPRYLFLPVSEYLKAPGVQASTRVGRYPVTFQFGVGGAENGHILAVDRTEYASIAFWRKDFASQPLAALMNALAATPDGILISEDSMRDQALNIGDVVPVKVQLPGDIVAMQLRIVGNFKLWPGWYPKRAGEGSLIIGNLEYLFESVGGQVPYDVWIKVKRGFDTAAVVPAARQIDKGTWDASDVGTLISDAQVRPERQGLFGMLSIGFLAATALTVLGFFLYFVFSYRRRFIQLGVLRAIGLSTRQMALSLAWEMALLLGIGSAVGTLLGNVISRFYIPFMQVGANDEMRALPFQVVTDWSAIYGVYYVFGALFVVVLVALVIFLRRVKIFQAVKLGEAE